MSSEINSNDSNHRRLERAAVQQSIVVFDVLNETEVGRVVNLHEEGFMLIGAHLVKENCLYQMVFLLSDAVNNKREVHVGAECLWIKETGGGDQNWAGFHIVDVADEDLLILRALSDYHIG